MPIYYVFKEIVPHRSDSSVNAVWLNRCVQSYRLNMHALGFPQDSAFTHTYSVDCQSERCCSPRDGDEFSEAPNLYLNSIKAGVNSSVVRSHLLD